MINKLILVDQSNLIYRNYYGLSHRVAAYPHLITQYTVGNVLKTLQKYKANRICIAADHSAPTFRHELFPDYKGNRDKSKQMRKIIKRQTAATIKLFRALGIRVERKAGMEADDIIGTLAYKVSKRKAWAACILGTDKDFAQCLTGGVSQLRYNTVDKKYTLVTPYNCHEVFNVPADRIVDYMMMIGDKADNIPSCPNVGEKTALKLIETCDRIEDADISVLNKRQRESFLAHAENFELVRQLVTIRTDCPVKLKNTKFSKPDYKLAKEVCEEYGVSYDLVLSFKQFYKARKETLIFDY